MHTLHAYEGKKLKLRPEFERILIPVLRIIAGRERDHYKVNLRTFHGSELKKAGLNISVRELLPAFEALEISGVCKISKGSMGRMEIVQFRESARQVARKLLGLHSGIVPPQSEPVGGNTLEAAREILRAEMPAEAKVKVLSSLLLKE